MAVAQWRTKSGVVGILFGRCKACGILAGPIRGGLCSQCTACGATVPVVAFVPNKPKFKPKHTQPSAKKCPGCGNLIGFKKQACRTCRNKARRERRGLSHKKTANRVEKKRSSGSVFYDSREWQAVKYQTLKRHGRKCMVCFRTNIEIHVDHIKPRSLYPDLELDPENLQVLCRDCNLGKSNTDCIDWRPKKEQSERKD